MSASEMKTLKDLDTAKDFTPLSRTHYEDFVDKEELKEEAIKWIKKLNSMANGDLDDEFYRKFGLAFIDSGYGEYSETRYGNVVDWIKQFFNITDEELK